MDDLVRQADRVRGLARCLVQDAAEADDLVQDAVVRAIERQSSTPPHGLARSIRDRAIDSWRRRDARRARERDAARLEARSTPADALIVAERQRDVAEAVLALDEVLRTVIVLRHFEDLPPRTIAARLGLPIGTVKKRLERGRARLRAQLEARYGERGAWAVALLPLTGTEVGRAAGTFAAIGGLATLWVGAVVGAAILAFALSRAYAPERTSTTAVVPESRSSAAPQTDDSHGVVLATPYSQRGSARERERPALNAPEPHPSLGLVVDVKGNPVADVDLRWVEHREAPALTPIGVTAAVMTTEDQAPEEHRGRSKADGRVVAPDLSAERVLAGSWIVESDTLATVGGGLSESNVPVVVVARTVRVAGRIVDGEGHGVPRARVTLAASLLVLADFPIVLHGPGSTSVTVRTTDTQGRFDLGRVAAAPGFEVVVSKKGLVVHRAGPLEDDLDFEVVLPPARESRLPFLHGRVLDFDGSPCALALVLVGQDSDVTDALGRFRIEVSSWWEGAPIIANYDHRFSVGPTPQRDAAAALSGAGPFTLRMPRTMSRIEGRLLDADGVPAEGFLVLPYDATQSGSTYQALGGPVGGGHVTTDSEGRFVLARLEDRSHELRFVHEASMFVLDVKGVVPGGAPRAFRLPRDGWLESLSGRIVDVFGQAVVGARVTLQASRWNPTTLGASRIVGREATTDARGRFTIEHAPWRGLSVNVGGLAFETVGMASFPLERRPAGPLRLEVERLCEVRVTVEGSPDVTAFAVLDELGERLELDQQFAHMSLLERVAQRNEHGGFPIMRVSQRAAVLVLLNESGSELRRVGLTLDLDQRNEIVQ